MKICIITSGFASWMGGVESVVYNLSKNWANQGHEVYILSGWGSIKPPKKVNLIKLPFISRSIFDKIPLMDRFPTLFFFPTFTLEGFTLLPFLFPYLKKIDPDIVLTCTLPETIVPLILQYPTVMFSQAGTFWRNCVYKKANEIIVNDPFSYYNMKLKGYKVNMILNGTNMVEYKQEKIEYVRKKYKIPNHGIKILSVSRIDSQKRIHLLIQAFKKITCESILIIVGDGPELNNLKNKYYDVPNILYLGRVPNEDVMILYKMSDVLTLPSYREAAAITLIEGLCSGIPIVTNNESIKRFYLKKYANYVNVENSEEYASALVNATSYEIKKIKGYNKYIRNFLWKNISKKYIDVFHEIICVHKIIINI